MNKQRRFLSFLVLTLGVVLFTACNDDDDTPTPPTGPTLNIVQTALASPQYSILVGALQATDLVATLEGPGPFTVFAPDNAAFNTLFDALEIPAGSNEDRLAAAAAALGVDAVRQLLLYHVLGGIEILAAQVPTKAYVTTSSTASPGENQLSLLIESNNGVRLNGGTNVVSADIRATNGVIHGINAVLTLPDVVDHALNNPADFSSLVSALVNANLVETLQGEGPFTVFAPVNAAFAEIEQLVNGLTVSQLSTVLKYHVVAGNARSTDLANGDYPTLSEQTFNVSLGATVTITDAAGETATVLLTDVQGTNGVVHVIDKVLLPTL